MTSREAPATFARGRYHVKHLLGEGGHKRVYLAHDTRLGRDVAFALIKTEGLDEAALARLRREAQAMARLGDHPHVVTVYDVGEEDGQTYVISQYMAGGSLDDVLRRAENHRLPLARVLHIGVEICRALEHAHAQSVIHRDLKPGNVWLTRDGVAKLGDFGLAVALDRSRLTAEAMLVGTVGYMPPEQALGKSADARSDLYSLGAMLYEMVTGRLPFLGDDAVAVLLQHINAPPADPSRHNVEVPRALDVLILRLLAKAPEERPEGAVAVRKQLETIAAAVSTEAAPTIEEQTNLLDVLAQSAFVGRREEMARLKAALEEARSGRGRLLLLVGEPGIGKTCTADELARYARLRQVHVLAGRCYEGEGAPAFWPWVQTIRSYLRDRDPATLRAEMGPGAADIAPVVPEVRELLPDSAPQPALEPEQARFRFFDSITIFLKTAARRQPLLLLLDDLQCADKPSLLLLQFLVRELGDARLLVVGTYRDMEVGRAHPLAATLADLHRERSTERLVLRGLPEEDVRALLATMGGLEPPADFVRTIFRETEGNPFFVKEMLRHLVEEGLVYREGGSWGSRIPAAEIGIPEGVRHVIGRRLARLSGPCYDVLTVAAVVGREFGLDVLERVSALDGERLLDALEEAVAARAIAEVPRAIGRYRFAHALIRDTLHGELGLIRRARLHRRIAEALEELHGADSDPHLAELAYHFFEGGGNPAKAVDYARRAGDRAVALLAYEEGIRLYEMALHALGTSEPVDERQRCELVLAVGDAQRRAGEPDKARAALRHAADLARKIGSPELLARAALAFGVGLSSGSVDQTSVSEEACVLEEALTALGENDSALHARLLARLALTLRYSTPDRSVSLSKLAVEMARRVGDGAALAYALNEQPLWWPERCEDRIAAATEALERAERAGEREPALEARDARLKALLEMGDIRAADRDMAAYARLADELREPKHQWLAAVQKAMRALFDGRFAEAEQLAEEALIMGRRVQSQDALEVFRAQLFYLRAAQGRLGEVEAARKAAVEEFPDFPPMRAALAYLFCELGREAEARREFDHLAPHDLAVLNSGPAGGVRMLAELSEVCAYLRDTRHAATLYECMLPYAGRIIVVPLMVACLGSTSRYLGLLAATMSRWDEAARHFEAALGMNARMGARVALACTQLDYAAMLLRRRAFGDREKTWELVARAVETGRELGMKSLVARAERLDLRERGMAAGDISP